MCDPHEPANISLRVPLLAVAAVAAAGALAWLLIDFWWVLLAAAALVGVLAVAMRLLAWRAVVYWPSQVRQREANKRTVTEAALPAGPLAIESSDRALTGVIWHGNKTLLNIVRSGPAEAPVRDPWLS